MSTARRLRAFLGIASLMAAFGTAVIGPAWAASAPATVTVTPTSVTAGSTGNTFTFKISAVAKLSSHTYLTVPAGWTAPQVSSKTGAGYVTAAKGSCTSAGKLAVTGKGPWTV